jgi:pyruvate kinase
VSHANANAGQLRRTKILATLGPATDAEGVLDELVRAGVNVVRMNFSHGTPEQHARRVEAVREAAARQGREVGILADLQGPKIRIEKFAEGRVALKSGQKFTLDCRPGAEPGDASRVGCSYQGLVDDVRAGDTLLLDDGLVAMRVISVEDGQVHTEVLSDGWLSDRKGLNRLGGGLSLGALSEQDKQHIVIAAQLGVDFIAVSFCRSAADMNEGARARARRRQRCRAGGEDRARRGDRESRRDHPGLGSGDGGARRPGRGDRRRRVAGPAEEDHPHRARK